MRTFARHPKRKAYLHMREIVLVRHAESTANTGQHFPHLHGDHHLRLSDRGFSQAQQLAAQLDSSSLQSAMVYCSPFARPRQTLTIVLGQLGLNGVHIHENALLREQDRGYTPEASQMALRRTHGWFWYRHAGGESPADVYLRVSLFLDALYRESRRSGRDTAFIFCHGMTIRCFVTRFLNLQVEDFERMANPRNCDIVRLAHSSTLNNPAFDNRRWAVTGIRLR